VILTAAFVTGMSIWQRSSMGTQHIQAAQTGVESPRAHIPATITSAELGEALFGSQASQYGGEATTPSSEAIAANNALRAQSETVVASSNPPVPGEALAASNEHPAPGEQTTTSHSPFAPSDGPPPTAVVAAIEPAPLTARGELMNAINPPANPPARVAALPSPPARAPSAPPKSAADPAARAQAERLVGQGDRQFADGNVAIARQYFARAVDLGFAPAAIKLAETFDAKALARHGVHGVKPDPAQAEKWRRRASELGQ
jgi:TPR repeat protein